MFKLDKIAKVYANNTDTGDTVEFLYHILDTNVSERWIALIDKNTILGNKLKYNYRKILNDKEIEKDFQIFKTNVDLINAGYDRQLTILTTVEDLYINRHKVLNDLHEEYEIYGDRLSEIINCDYFSKPMSFPNLYKEPWPGMIQDKIVHDAFLLLNEQIHNFESIFRAKSNPENTLCSCLIDFLPKGYPTNFKPEEFLHEPLKPEDYFLFSPETHWGWMYLGYNTLGKHWISTMMDDDVEVVKRGQIRPQARFAAECYMHFKKTRSFATQWKLYKWWTKNNFSEILDPCMKLDELALGYIPIGKIYSYKINNEQEVKVPDNVNTIEWNKDVWSRFDNITDIKIFTVPA